MQKQNLKTAALSAALHGTGKVTVTEERLKTMIDENTPSENLLILIKDVPEFVRAITETPGFDHVRVLVAETGLEKNTSVAQNQVLIFRDELPGPLARVNLPWDRLPEIISWACVETVDEVKTVRMHDPI
jgi:hypothetical protein